MTEDYDAIDIFCEVFNTRRPEQASYENGVTDEEIEDWLKPMQHMWHLKPTMAAFKQTMIRAKHKAKGLTIATPASIESTFCSLVSEERNEPTPEEYAAYRRKVVALGYNVI